VFVDCGAYDGDTLLTFLNQSGGGFREAYAFEPDPRNVTRLESALAGLPESARSNIQLQAIAVGNVSGSVGMLLSDAASSVAAAGDVTVPCEPLDAVLERTTPTYLKMDIEGAEIDALDGARSLISANRPVLAISAYHFQDHIWAIPLLVESMVDGYRYHLRRYTSPPNDNLVVYAIPEERWIGGHARTANVES
jgi:FkbM family methyltransferase